MEFDVKGTRPIWQQLSDHLRECILTGVYGPGGKFPAVRELAVQCGVNPNTMQRAVAQLEAEGLVMTNRTAGRTVTEDAAALEGARRLFAAERVQEFLTGMQTLGYSPAEAMEMLEEETKQ